MTGRDESQSVPSPGELFQTRDLGLPFFEGSLPSCSPEFAGYTRPFLHPYFPVAKHVLALNVGVVKMVLFANGDFA